MAAFTRKPNWENYRDWVLGSKTTSFRLLSKNMKTEMQDGNECLTYCLHLSPHKESVKYGGTNLCHYASPACAANCLVHTGRHQMGQAKQRRIERTLWYLNDPETFHYRLGQELDKAYMRASKKDLKLAGRLDGVSDIGLGRLYAPHYPEIIFYDYTKDFTRIADWVSGKAWNLNYFLTFSWSGKNLEECIACLRRGVNVAVPFWPSIPETFLGYPVVDGTYDDRRFMDPQLTGTVIGLKFKGSRKRRNHAIQNGFCILENLASSFVYGDYAKKFNERYDKHAQEQPRNTIALPRNGG